MKIRTLSNNSFFERSGTSPTTALFDFAFAADEHIHIRAIDPTVARCTLEFPLTRRHLEEPRWQALLNGINRQGYNLSVCLNHISTPKPQITNKLTTDDDVDRQNVIIVRYDNSPPSSKFECPIHPGVEETLNSQRVTSRLVTSFQVDAANAVYEIFALDDSQFIDEEWPSTNPSSKRAQIAPNAHYQSNGFVPMPGSRVYGSDGVTLTEAVSLHVNVRGIKIPTPDSTLLKAVRKLSDRLSAIEMGVVALKKWVHELRTSQVGSSRIISPTQEKGLSVIENQELDGLPLRE